MLSCNVVIIMHRHEYHRRQQDASSSSCFHHHHHHLRAGQQCARFSNCFHLHHTRKSLSQFTGLSGRHTHGYKYGVLLFFWRFRVKWWCGQLHGLLGPAFIVLIMTTHLRAGLGQNRPSPNTLEGVRVMTERGTVCSKMLPSYYSDL